MAQHSAFHPQLTLEAGVVVDGTRHTLGLLSGEDGPTSTHKHTESSLSIRFVGKPTQHAPPPSFSYSLGATGASVSHIYILLSLYTSQEVSEETDAATGNKKKRGGG
jgi:hypothetical protein